MSILPRSICSLFNPILILATGGQSVFYCCQQPPDSTGCQVSNTWLDRLSEKNRLDRTSRLKVFMSGQYQQTQHKVRTVPTDSKECQLSGQYHQTTECQISTTRLQNVMSVPLDSTECQVSTARLQNVRSVPTVYWMSLQYQQTVQIVMSLPTDSIQNVRSFPPDSTECQVSTNRLQNVRAVPPTTECQVSTNRLYRISGQYH